MTTRTPPTWRSTTDDIAIHIGVLGSFSLRVQGQDVSLPAGAQRLVAMLVVRGRIGRSRLAGMLWPQATEHRALASLRTGIWRTNQAACGLVLSDHGTVRLGLEPHVDLQRLVERSRLVLDGQDPPDDDGWEQGTLAGELLEDWDDEWLEPERERLRQLRLHVMDAEARRLTRLGRYGLALDLALTALQADRLRESAHRLVVEIHLAEGNVSEARRSYEACRDLLEAELGIRPSQGLADLVERAVPPEPAGIDRELAGIG